MTAHNQTHTGEAAPANETESLLKQVQELESQVRGVVKTQLQLAGMETRRAGESFVRMVAFAVIAALLTFSAWAVLVTAAIVAIVNSNILSLTTALIVVAAAHLGAAFYIVRYIKQRSRDLLFAETTSSL